MRRRPGIDSRQYDAHRNQVIGPYTPAWPSRQRLPRPWVSLNKTFVVALAAVRTVPTIRRWAVVARRGQEKWSGPKHVRTGSAPGFRWSLRLRAGPRKPTAPLTHPE